MAKKKASAKQVTRRKRKPRAPAVVAEAPRERGRPTVYTEEAADEILHRLAAGEALRTICSADGMPSEAAVRGWALDDRPPGFAARYARAREIAYDGMADQILEIAKTQVIGERIEEETTEVEMGEGDAKETLPGVKRKVVREDAIGHRKLQIDAMKWTLVKRWPERFGDRVKQEHSGKVGVAYDSMLRDALGLEGDDAAS